MRYLMHLNAVFLHAFKKAPKILYLHVLLFGYKMLSCHIHVWHVILCRNVERSGYLQSYSRSGKRLFFLCDSLPINPG